MSSTTVEIDQIRETAFRFGFDHCAVTPAQISPADIAAYESWCADGFAAGMEYMSRDPKKRVDVQQLLVGAKTVVTLGVSYFQGPVPPKPGPGYGRVARYAWGLDYHPIILSRLDQLLETLRKDFGLMGRTVSAVDTKPLLERALARSAGLGFIGKNTVLIVPKIQFHVGSWVFLGEIILDAEICHPRMPRPSPPNVSVGGPRLKHAGVTITDSGGDGLGGCGSCTKCLDACPTEAFERPYRLDAKKCIAYLTIENKGGIPLEMREKVGDWIFGCDVCQEVCPFNARAFETRWPEFLADRGVGSWVSLKQILETPGQPEFKSRWGHTPLSRSKWRGLVRNALVAAGNSGDRTLRSAINPLTENTDEMIREHAQWAQSKLI